MGQFTKLLLPDKIRRFIRRMQQNSFWRSVSVRRCQIKANCSLESSNGRRTVPGLPCPLPRVLVAPVPVNGRRHFIEPFRAGKFLRERVARKMLYAITPWMAERLEQARPHQRRDGVRGKAVLGSLVSSDCCLPIRESCKWKESRRR